eukprot:118324-Prymnesium_polylepis.1
MASMRGGKGASDAGSVAYGPRQLSMRSRATSKLLSRAIAISATSSDVRDSSRPNAWRTRVSNRAAPSGRPHDSRSASMIAAASPRKSWVSTEASGLLSIEGSLATSASSASSKISCAATSASCAGWLGGTSASVRLTT